MKIADVVNQAKLILPAYSSLFGDVQNISSIVATSGTAVVTTTSAHGLKTNQVVNMAGIETRTPVLSASKTGTVVTFTTNQDHDLTFGWPEHANVTLSGFEDDDWNGTFALKSSDNRRTFAIQSANAAPTGAMGVLLEQNRVDGINGLFQITVTGATTFSITGDFNDGTYTPVNGSVSTNVRMAASVDIQSVIEKYTENVPTKFWLFVEPIDVDVSKDRSTFSDAIATKTQGVDMRTRMLDGFTVYIIAPTHKQFMAEEAIDVCRHDLQRPIMRAFYGAKFDSGLSTSGDFKTILNTHGIYAYNRSFLVYQYQFQSVFDLTDGDTVLPSQTRAFRNIDYTESIGDDDVTDLTVNSIDLDINPL